jgi:hypothetical protein
MVRRLVGNAVTCIGEENLILARGGFCGYRSIRLLSVASVSLRHLSLSQKRKFSM